MMNSTPPIVNIVGSGSAALIQSITDYFSSRGYRIATVAKAANTAAADNSTAEGQTSCVSGAVGSACIQRGGLYFPFPPSAGPEKMAHCLQAFRHCHLILAEADTGSPGDTIEIITDGEAPIYSSGPGLTAVVGSGTALPGMPCFAPDDIAAICLFIQERYLNASISAAVLAGGKSSRLGQNKALLEIDGKTTIERVLQTVARCVSTTKIITNTPGDYEHLGIETAPDIRPGCGPLSGIHAALVTSATEYVLVVSCDVPLIEAALIQKLITGYAGFDITIFKHKNFEPLCAVYRRSCIQALDELIDHRECRIIDLFPTLTVNVLRIERDERFRSINTGDDYSYIKEKINKGNYKK